VVVAQEAAPGLVCFDLDGTLVDPLPGVQHCLAKTCEAFGLAMPEETTIRDWIGFGMRESLATLKGLEDSARLDAAIDFYWERYREEGVFEHELYPGIFHLLHRLKRQGHRIYIVSAKPGLFARRIAYQFDLNLIFDDIFGSTLKGRWQPKTRGAGRPGAAGHHLARRRVHRRPGRGHGRRTGPRPGTGGGDLGLRQPGGTDRRRREAPFRFGARTR